MGTLDELEKTRFMNMIRDSIITLCKNGIIMSSIASVEGLLGITLENNEVFLVNIKEELLSIQKSQAAASHKRASSPPKRLGQGSRAKRRKSQDSSSSAQAQAVSLDSTDSEPMNTSGWQVNRPDSNANKSAIVQSDTEERADIGQQHSFSGNFPIHVAPVVSRTKSESSPANQTHNVSQNASVVSQTSEMGDELVQIKSEPSDPGEGTSSQVGSQSYYKCTNVWRMV